MEDELRSLREMLTASLLASKTLLLKTQRASRAFLCPVFPSTESMSVTITQERRTIAKIQEDATAATHVHVVDLAKAQRAIATLQSQHKTDNLMIAQLASNITEVLVILEDMESRLKHLEESEHVVLQDVEATRELVAELTTDKISPPDMTPRDSMLTLAGEFMAAPTSAWVGFPGASWRKDMALTIQVHVQRGAVSTPLDV